MQESRGSPISPLQSCKLGPCGPPESYLPGKGNRSGPACLGKDTSEQPAALAALATHASDKID